MIRAGRTAPLLVVLLALVLPSTQSAAADVLPQVTGVVTNLAGSPSPNVSVSNTNGPAGGTTDTAGKFGFS
ncbi:hypothetical protein GCM10011376_35090 [Nocardioides flavus (ex Wang et al. 2016)]|uniref:Carboxypeptidase regulatory-like domain-containing protein n=1 Tax=Nocardioides flavus (ex Wang et al. 2016) TaxID=2058780 RepID=A0ABQ3HRW4_9ACTN|nr:hypothetical protein GCM10011376_35090 [Nocardioides flavus (ex Wang et al. 2016)]